MLHHALGPGGFDVITDTEGIDHQKKHAGYNVFHKGLGPKTCYAFFGVFWNHFSCLIFAHAKVPKMPEAELFPEMKLTALFAFRTFLSEIEYDIIPCKAIDFMVWKRRFGRIPAGRANFFKPLAVHNYTKPIITSCLLTLSALAQRIKKNLSETITTIRSRFGKKFNLRREKPIYVRKTSRVPSV